jgi:radical SAM superfamily enzyme YgiQ (UPF0313 family)
MTKKVKFVLIQPFSLFSNYLDMENSVPTQLLYLASSLREKLRNSNISHSIEIINLIDFKELKPLKIEDFTEYLNKFADFLKKYDDGSDLIFGISVFTSNYYLCSISIMKIIRNLFPNSLICVGGCHANYVPEDFIIEEGKLIDSQTTEFPENYKLVDYIFLGESEISFSNTMYKLIIESKTKSNKFESTKIIRSDIIKDLNTLPKLDLSFYNFKAGEIYQIPIYFSRDCPYNCSYCSEYRYIDSKGQRKKWRLCSPEFAYEQILETSKFIKENLKKKGVKARLQICDPLFGYPNWRIKLYKLLIERKFEEELYAELRVDQFNIANEMQYLIQLNFALEFGFESASPRILEIMNKTNNPNKYIQKMEKIVDAFQENNIYCLINIIIGHPGENSKSLNETMEFMNRITEKTTVVLPFFFKYLFSLGSGIYNDMNYYEIKYGTKFYSKKYWKHPLCSYIAAGNVDPSTELTLFPLLNESFPLIKNIYQNVKKNLKILKMGDIAEQFKNNMIYKYAPMWKLFPKRFEEFRDKKTNLIDLNNRFWDILLA